MAVGGAIDSTCSQILLYFSSCEMWHTIANNVNSPSHDLYNIQLNNGGF